MKNDKLTVIMSNYNQEKYIEQAIESVLTQKTTFDVRLIITDDFSVKDRSLEIIQKYADKYPEKITALLNTENGGYLKNILRAKAITKTTYFTLLDADDYWTDENHLQKAVDFLDSHPDFTIYNANVMRVEENGESSIFVNTPLKIQDIDAHCYLNQGGLVTQTTGMVFRNVIFANGIPSIMEQAVGTASEVLLEGDYGRFIMHLKYGKSHFVNEVCGVYRILSEGIWSGLSDFSKRVLLAQTSLFWNSFLEGKYDGKTVGDRSPLSWNSFLEGKYSASCLFEAYKNFKMALSYIDSPLDAPDCIYGGGVSSNDSGTFFQCATGA